MNAQMAADHVIALLVGDVLLLVSIIAGDGIMVCVPSDCGGDLPDKYGLDPALALSYRLELSKVGSGPTCAIMDKFHW